MKPLYSYIILAVIYLSIMSLGLRVGGQLIFAIDAGIVPPVVSDPEKASSSLTIFAYIIFMTCVLLILLKYGLYWIMKGLLVLSLFGGAFISFSSFTEMLALPLAAAAIIVYYLKQKNIWVTNTLLVFSLSGVGGLIGASLGTTPSLLLILILAAYDLVAVFGTKHMVTLAEGTKERLPLMFSIPLFESNLGLGTGDLVIPLVFTVSVLRDHTLAHASLTAFGGFMGVTALFAYILARGRATLPALPPITLGLICGYASGLLLL